MALPAVSPADRRRAQQLLAALDTHYPGARCALRYSSPHELLVATILSAQCTDAAVNKATPALFAAFPSPAHFAAATPEQIEPYIRSLGFFRAKAKAIHEAMREIQHRFGGQVPPRMADLITLRGVARKTANVVLGNAFGINDGVVVDTHVQRLARRFGLARPDDNPDRIELRLMALFPRDRWTDLGHMLIAHGRAVCTARRPACADHPICQQFGIRCELRARRNTSSRSRNRR